MGAITGARAGVTCEGCGAEFELERRFVRPEIVPIICPGCEHRIEVVVTGSLLAEAGVVVKPPLRFPIGFVFGRKARE